MGWLPAAIRGECRARLALAAGAGDQHPVARQLRGVVLAEKARPVPQIAVFPRRLVHPAQGSAAQGGVPAGRPGDRGDRLEPRDVRREGGNGDPAVVFADQIDQALPDIRFRAGPALLEHVGRIADQRQDAVIADPAQRRLVDRRADQRVRVELPVAGVEHGAQRRADQQGVRLRDRMGQAYEFDAERTDLEGRAGFDRGDPGVVLQIGFGQLALQHRGGETGGVDRALQPGPEMRHRADMILMGMGQDQAGQPVPALDDEFRVGRNHLDSGDRGIAERHAQIDHQPAAAIAEQVEVHADFAGAAERQEMEGIAAHARFLA